MRETKKILIICTANSARSQMAEGLLKHICKNTYIVNSAGTAATFVRPEAIEVMREIGIDISGNRSKSLGELSDVKFDYVLTVCNNARDNCPYFPAKIKLVHHPFEDPAAVEGDEESRIEAFRRVRDQIKEYLESTFRKIIET